MTAPVCPLYEPGISRIERDERIEGRVQSQGTRGKRVRQINQNKIMSTDMKCMVTKKYIYLIFYLIL